MVVGIKNAISKTESFKEEEFMKRLRDFLNRFCDYMAAISFAEAGEFDTAREILRETNRDRQIKRQRTTQVKRFQMRA